MRTSRHLVRVEDVRDALEPLESEPSQELFVLQSRPCRQMLHLSGPRPDPIVRSISFSRQRRDLAVRSISLSRQRRVASQPQK